MEIIYEDNHLIIVNKKSGELVQGDKTGDAPMSDYLKQYIKDKYNKPGEVFLGTVHRIDRPVSGIVIFARTSKALERMNKLFQDKGVQKTYLAVVKNRPPKEADLLVHYLLKNEKQNKSYAKEQPFGKALKCELEYKVLAHSDNYQLLEINPHTGRHHQIRCQLATIGSPIKGDLKYGFNRSNEDGSIHLHAYAVRFLHPVTKEELYITCPPPKEALWDYFRDKI
ncbi:MAG: RNA pseudouridine synthase [Bacteroidota bacterium]